MHPSLLKQSHFVDELLDRKAPAEYLLDWQKAILLRKQHPERESHTPYIFFRLEKEYFAINALLVGEITTLRAVHHLPHMKIPFIEGLVNVNGRLRIFVCIEKLLALQNPKEPLVKKEEPLVLIEKEGFVWTFSVTEVLGMVYVPLQQIRAVPVVAMRPSERDLKGLYPWQEHLVGLLDEELLTVRVRQGLEMHRRG